jgi:heme-degrading monooxygenase HmoA
MHAMAVEFTMPEGTDFAALREVARQRVGLYEGMAGLRYKAFVVDPGRRVYGGLYVWESRERIEAFLRSDVFQGAVAKFGQPEVRVYEVAAVVEPGVAATAG